MSMRKRNRGNAVIEFTLVGIPMMFALISIAEMSRGMWVYHSLAHAVKEGTRYAAVRGQNYTYYIHANNTYRDVCAAIVNAGPGLLPNQLTLSFHSDTVADAIYKADACPATAWPPGGTSINPIVDNQPGRPITITATYPFESAIAMFWPSHGSGMNMPAFILPAEASETMQF